MAIAPGTTLGRYDIRSPLGAGGMGEVYLAEDTSLHRKVAIKFLPAETAGDDHARKRLLREAQAAATLDHPNICAVYEVAEAGGHQFIVMQYIEGETLAARLARKSLDVRESLSLGAQIADALAEAHARGILHRDIKPQNVMITPRGQAKLMDFGLAMRAPEAGVTGEAATASLLTAPGAILGTVQYMSPEQVQGQPLDARSDIFSFGVMLYEMVSGHHPFAGESQAATTSAILTRTPEPVARFAANVPPELDRIIAKSIAKEKDERYQSTRDLLIDLQALAKDPAGSAASGRIAAPAPRRRRLRAALVGGAVAVVMIAAGFSLWPRLFRASPVISTDEVPSVAVMYFQNNTGSTELEWLHKGLTEMLVTDLSQSPDITVLGTDRLYSILAALKRQDDPVVSFDTVQEVARRAPVSHVVVGQYMKAGETIRISITLQEATTGKIVSSEKVDALGESSLFATVDDLIRRIKATFSTSAARRALIAPPGTTAPPYASRALTQITTSSPEAYRFFVEARDLLNRGQNKEAIALYEKAIEIDKDFASAIIGLSVSHMNLGHSAQSEEYATRAMALLERLSPRQRFITEAMYYAQKDETIQKTIDAYTKWLALYPKDAPPNTNLADTNNRIEQFDDAIRMTEERIQRGPPLGYNSTENLAFAYSAVGQFEAARKVMDELLSKNPKSVAGHRRLGAMLTLWGKFDDGRQEYAKADAIDGGTSASNNWIANALQDKWTEADAVARKSAQSQEPNTRILGNVRLAIGELYRGRTASALRLLEVAWTSQEPPGSSQTAHARYFASAILLAQGQHADALVQARRAFEEAGGSVEMWESLYCIALAESRLGQRAESAKTTDALTAKANTFPGNREKRRVHQLAGVLALDRRDTTRALDELLQAEAMMPAGGNGVFTTFRTTYLPTWFDLGTAFVAAGRDADAHARFLRVVNSPERREYPLQFVRSLYLLGQIAERSGKREEARAYYQRFVGYWGNGDIDRAQVADAKRKLAMK